MKNEYIFYDVIYKRFRDTGDTDSVHFVKEIENESNICRYMDLPELIYLIKEQKLEFKQLSLFDDSNENRIFLSDEFLENCYQKDKKDINITFKEFSENYKHLQTINCLKIYALCFTLNYDEKYMWDQYTDKQVMVKVKNINTLANSFKIESTPNPDIWIEEIKYVDTKNLQKSMAQLDDYFTHPYVGAFIKDKAYEKEREIRTVCQVDTIYEGSPNLNPATAAHLPSTLQINTNPNQFIKEIILSPKLPESKQKTIKSIINTLSPHLTVSPSRIKSPPNLYKKIIKEIDFSGAPKTQLKNLGNYKQISINNNGTFDIKVIS